MLTSAAYVVDLPARAMAPFYRCSDGSSSGTHQFVVGTSCFTGDNSIRLLTFQEELRSLECSRSWPHEEEIFGLWSSPLFADRSLLAAAARRRCSVLRVPDDISAELELVVELGAACAQVLWDLEGLQNEVKLITENSLRIYSLADGKVGEEVSRFCVGGCRRLLCAALDPHHSQLCLAAAEGAGIALVDVRKKEPTVIPNTATLHGLGTIHNIDFSTTRENLFVTAGSDGMIIWHDLRMDGVEIAVERKQYLEAHDHCVWRSLFNPFCEELLMSCGSDHTLRLWDTSKCGVDGERAQRVARLSDFADSVVACCWSSTSPWVFAGLSYNGRVLVDSVPEECKARFAGKAD